jgi:hypothetical protein
MKTLIIAILLALSVPVAAKDFYLYTGALTYHPDGFDEGVTNESHALVAIEYDSVMAGYYDNSFGDPTVFASYRFHTNIAKHVEAGLQIGVNFGYKGACFKSSEFTESDMLRFCPEATLTLSYTKYDAQPWIGLRGPIPMLGVRWNIDLN